MSAPASTATAAGCVEIGRLAATWAEEFAEIASEHGMPLKQFTRLCVLGGDAENTCRPA